MLPQQMDANNRVSAHCHCTGDHNYGNSRSTKRTDIDCKTAYVQRARANRRGPPIVTIASEGTASSFIPCQSCTILLQVFQRTAIASEQLNQLEWTRECAQTTRKRSKFDQSLIKFTLSFKIQCNHIKNPLLPTMTTLDFFNDSGGYRNYCEGRNSFK